MSDLTETQKTILQAAAERTDGSIHPLPERIKGGAACKVIDALNAKGLIADNGLYPPYRTWRINEAGYLAIGLEKPQQEEASETMESVEPAETNDEEICMTTSDTTELANDGDSTTLANDDDATDMATSDDVTTLDTTGLANNDDATDMATSDATELANDDTTEEAAPTSDEGQSGWTDEPDPEILALARKHFPNFSKEEWPAIRNTIEEAYSWGFNDAKAKPKRQTNNAAANTGTPKKDSKQSMVVEMLKRPEGATTAQIAEATGWQLHSIRGFLSIAKKKLGMEITTQRTTMVGPNKQGSPGSYTRYFAA